MNEAVIFQSPHAIKPEIYLTKAEREERYRTRLDETFRPYTVLDVLTRVYRHRPEDDLDEALGKNLGAFVSLEGGNSVSRAWVADCRIIRVETLFFQPLDDFLVAWDNVALLMRQRSNKDVRTGPTRGSVWVRPAGAVAPGTCRLYSNGELHLLGDDFCSNGGVLAWSTPDERPHATTAHRTFHFVEPEQGGLRLGSEGEHRKYTVYAIDTAGSMLVGDATL